MDARITLLLATCLVAGCMAPAADVDAQRADDAPSSPLMERLGAQPAPAADASAAAPGAPDAGAPPAVDLHATWYVATVQADASTGISAIEWIVPQGALVPWAMNEDFGTDDEVVALEFALVTDADVAPERWGFVAFEDHDGMMVPGAGAAYLPVTVTPYGGAGIAAAASTSIEEAPSTGYLSLWDVEAGQTMRFLLFAGTPSPAEVGFAFRVLDHDPTSDDEPAASADAFLAARNGTRPIALPSRATANGFAMSVYTDALYGGFPAGPLVGIEAVWGEPTVTWNLPAEARALGGVHTLHAVASGTIDHGFDLVDAGYASLGVGAMRYTATADLHGSAESVSGASPDAWPAIFAGVPVFPGGSATGTGDGDGASAASLELERVFVNGLVASSSVGVLEFGATLDELFGTPAAPLIETYDSSLVPLEATRGGLPMRLPGGGALALWVPEEIEDAYRAALRSA